MKSTFLLRIQLFVPGTVRMKIFLIPVLMLIFTLVAGCAQKEVRQPDYKEPRTITYKSLKTPEEDAFGVPVEEERKIVPLQQGRQETPGLADGKEEQVFVERILMLPDIDQIDKRLQVYSDKLLRWRKLDREIVTLGVIEDESDRWGQCYADIEKIFTGYSRLMEITLEENSLPDGMSGMEIDPWLVYQRDIEYLESDCENIFLSRATQVSGWLQSFFEGAAGQAESVVAQYAAAGQYEKAVEAYENYATAYPEREMSPQTEKVYGLALLRLGKFDKALGILEQYLEDKPQERGAASIRRMVADLYLAGGQVKKSRNLYQELDTYFSSRRDDRSWVNDQLNLLNNTSANAEELPFFKEVLKGYIRFNGRHMPEGMRREVERMEKAFPDSIFTLRAQQILIAVENQVRDFLGDRLVRIDRLVENREYEKAKELLEELSKNELPQGVEAIVAQTLNQVTFAEEQEEQVQRALIEETLSSKYEEAANLFDLRKYDAAIEAFKELYNTDYDQRARDKVKEAAMTAATTMRRQAASLFVKARRAEDEERKRALFIESWQLLKKITIKYPDVSIIGKVIQNLKILEEQMNEFDPTIFNEITVDDL